MSERSFSEESKAEIRIYRAEARFLRALSYYHAMDMFGNVPFVDENTKMKEALRILNNKKLGILVCQNKKGKTVGIITDGQIRRFNQKKPNLQSMSVKHIMTKKPISINKNDLAAKALALMNNKKITSLCVYNGKNNDITIGVVHIHHILQSNVS